MKAKILGSPVIEIEGESAEITEIIKLISEKKNDRVESSVVKKVEAKKSPRSKPKKTKQKKWTSEDVAELKEYYNKSLPLTELASLTGRTVNAIKLKIIKLINEGELSQKVKAD